MRRAPTSRPMTSPGRTLAAGRAGRPLRTTRPAWHRLLASARRRTRRLSCRNLSSRTPQREHLVRGVLVEAAASSPDLRLHAREPVAESGGRLPERLLTIEMEISGQVGDGEEQVAELPRRASV